MQEEAAQFRSKGQVRQMKGTVKGRGGKSHFTGQVNLWDSLLEDSMTEVRDGDQGEAFWNRAAPQWGVLLCEGK